VLVLLTAYNGSRFIAEQIRSILAQRDVELAVAVRDDGSSDETRAEIARVAHDRRILVSASSGGRSGSAAQNLFTLMRENPARDFDFVAFADQDDVWHEDKIERACRWLAHGTAAGYSSATIASWACGRERILRQVQTQTRADFLFEGAGQGCTFVLARGFYARVRALVCRHAPLTAQLHYHDWAVYALARAWGLPWRFDALPPCATGSTSTMTPARGAPWPVWRTAWCCCVRASMGRNCAGSRSCALRRLPAIPR